MQQRMVLAVAMIGFALVATSCGAAAEKLSEEAAERALESASGGDVDLDISGDGDEFTVNVDSEDGTFSIGSDVELPSELQIPVPDGGSATSAGTQEGSAFASITYPIERYDELIAFYDNWTAGTGGEWDTSTTTFLDAPVVILMACDERAIGGPQIAAGIAGQNMNLAAMSLGLGFCWIGFKPTATTESKVPRITVRQIEKTTIYKLDCCTL